MSRRTARGMTGIFFGALMIAGAFTFWPGRIMHAVVFGKILSCKHLLRPHAEEGASSACLEAWTTT